MQGVNVLNNEELNVRDLIFAENDAHDFSTIGSSLYCRTAIDLLRKMIRPDKENNQEAEIELFNIVTDSFEDENLAELNPDKVKELINIIESWWDNLLNIIFK